MQLLQQAPTYVEPAMRNQLLGRVAAGLGYAALLLITILTSWDIRDPVGFVYFFKRPVGDYILLPYS